MNRNLRVILCEDNQFAGKYESISREILIFPYQTNKIEILRIQISIHSVNSIVQGCTSDKAIKLLLCCIQFEYLTVI